ncbi:MAG TPA: DUF4430 domain-containing protein [Pirellulaceae bacterium]|nr:DUF4430 domain-containing protein [Pirellulaceae bacterium]HMO93883.1 DUF4430 domain-containing protein [Pirellulaceae bacterium]HMP70896.1 DUF4430 domain-containing protein [Pirellulaceae bacterium]
MRAKIQSSVAIALVVLILQFSAGCRNRSNSETTTTPTQITVVLSITGSARELDATDLSVPTGSTVFQLMQIAAQKKLITLDDFSETLGQVFIKSINGQSNSQQQGRYWLFYVNDELSKVGCNSYILENGDQIRWSFAESPY